MFCTEDRCIVGSMSCTVGSIDVLYCRIDVLQDQCFVLKIDVLQDLRSVL